MTSSTTVGQTELRARFAARLSDLYGREVPAYTTLLEVSREVNERARQRLGEDAERFGSLDRVTAERHGAIRVGSVVELRQAARVFEALGMHPCGFYDLRDAQPRPIPVVSTAFRPIDREELAVNPFRVFTSMLVPEDRRFFDADLRDRLTSFVAARELFSDELLRLADVAGRDQGLDETAAARFLDLSAESFALSPEPVDRGWYAELERVSGVAADIGGVRTTHINHLTPRVLDIDDLYASMSARGVEMIDEIQGPPRWAGPDVLLRQTSFRALAEPRRFREADGTVSEGTLSVRFGEVEARGIALTRAGRDLYDTLLAEVDRRRRDAPDRSRAEVAAQVWAESLPDTERELARRGLGFFTYRVGEGPTTAAPSGDVDALVDAGWLELEPIVYEDFLPRSAAGIFSSNLGDQAAAAGAVEGDGGAGRNVAWMSEQLERPVRVPEEVYAAESRDSLDAATRELGVRV